MSEDKPLFEKATENGVFIDAPDEVYQSVREKIARNPQLEIPGSIAFGNTVLKEQVSFSDMVTWRLSVAQVSDLLHKVRTFYHGPLGIDPVRFRPDASGNDAKARNRLQMLWVATKNSYIWMCESFCFPELLGEHDYLDLPSTIDRIKHLDAHITNHPEELVQLTTLFSLLEEATHTDRFIEMEKSRRPLFDYKKLGPRIPLHEMVAPELETAEEKKRREEQEQERDAAQRMEVFIAQYVADHAKERGLPDWCQNWHSIIRMTSPNASGVYDSFSD